MHGITNALTQCMNIQSTKTSLKIVKEYSFSKVGIDEIDGLKEVMIALMQPVKEWVKESIYWNDCDLDESEYKSRDGFIPYSHNFGGIELTVIIPSVERDTFSFLEYGECDECKPGDNNQCGYNGQECASESEGHLDAKLRIWLKFEGLENGVMSFYLYLGGGNGDAPYFRTKGEATVFELSFTAKSLAGLKRTGAAAIKKMFKEVT